MRGLWQKLKVFLWGPPERKIEPENEFGPEDFDPMFDDDDFWGPDVGKELAWELDDFDAFVEKELNMED